MKPSIAFERDGWVRLGRAAVAGSVILWLAMAAVLLTAPAPELCRGGHLRGGSSLWDSLWLWGLPINAFGCLMAVRPTWLIRRMIEAETDAYPMEAPATYYFVGICVMNSVAAQL